MAAVILLALVSSAAAFWLIARPPQAGALIGLAMAAIALEHWLGACIFPVGSDPSGPRMGFIHGAVRALEWVPPVLIGCAIAWCGFRSVGRVAAALVSLALLWTSAALVIAVFNATVNERLSHYPQEMIDAGFQVFRVAATTPEWVFPRLVRAVVVAVIGTAVLAAAHLVRASSAPTA